MSRIRFLANYIFIGAAALAVLLLLACGSDPTPSPSPEPTATPVPTPTPMPMPTPTAVPVPTTTPSPTPEPLPPRDTFIPEGATIVVDARPSDILQSPVMEPLLDLLFNGEEGVLGFFDEFESETGISLRSIEFAEMYLDLAEVFEVVLNGSEDSDADLSNDLSNLGVALRGDLDEDDFVARLEESTAEDPGQDYETATYRGYTIYADSGENPDGFSFAFADEDTLLFGTADGVRAMIDVASGAAAQLSGEGVRALEGLGERDFGLIMVMPEGLPDAAMEGGEDNGNPLSAFGLGALAPQLTVMTLRLEGRSMGVQILEYYDQEADAAAAKEYNEGTMAMLGSMTGSADIQQLIADSEISQEGRSVSYEIRVDDSAVVAILNFLTSFMALGEAQPQG